MLSVSPSSCCMMLLLLLLVLLLLFVRVHVYISRHAHCNILFAGVMVPRIPSEEVAMKLAIIGKYVEVTTAYRILESILIIHIQECYGIT